MFLVRTADSFVEWSSGVTPFVAVRTADSGFCCRVSARRNVFGPRPQPGRPRRVIERTRPPAPALQIQKSVSPNFSFHLPVRNLFYQLCVCGCLLCVDCHLSVSLLHVFFWGHGRNKGRNFAYIIYLWSVHCPSNSWAEPPPPQCWNTPPPNVRLSPQAQ